MSNDIDKRAEEVFKKHRELANKKQNLEGRLDSIKQDMEAKGFSTIDEMKAEIENLNKKVEEDKKACEEMLDKAEEAMEGVV